jgi:hypothetical protein
MLQAERVADYLRSKLPQASEVTVENVFRIPGGASRETWSFDAPWQQSISILERSVTGSHAPTGLTGLADRAGGS